MTDGKLTGKVAIVTGAGQGAGMGASLAMAAEGAAVVLFGRTFSKVEKVAAEIIARGGKAVPFGGDVTRESDIAACIDLTLATYGRIDILVNAAQSPEMRTSKLLDISLEDIFELWNSGAAATLLFMRAVHPHMVKAGGGSIVNFGSGAQYGPAHYGVYAGVKAAIEKISRAAAMEWAKVGIRVNTVVPMVNSPANDADPTSNETLERIIPLRRIGDPEQDIGRPIAFLASEESAYITGSVLMLDGGLSYLS
ncbi:MAG TPA: SDR family oxidoreductase [Alphaproteobacteria bacterium]|jgi:NAD(P)-dependent dehydrogenase (short-subunit alcohol dehydrogenase family)|nr:SDR family oxidoreductase [Alphaproteobacteria bacterium]